MTKPTVTQTHALDSAEQTSSSTFLVTFVQENYHYRSLRATSLDEARTQAIEIIAGKDTPHEDIGDPEQGPPRIASIKETNE